MNAVRKLELLDAMSEFGKSSGLTPKGITSLAGCIGHKDEKWARDMFPKFSWVGKKALQMALITHRAGKQSLQGKIAMTEIARAFSVLKPVEVMAISTALEHGIYGLRKIEEGIKLFSK